MFFDQNNQTSNSLTNKMPSTHLQQSFFNVYVRTSNRKAYSIQISNSISKESFQQKIMSRIKIPVQNQILYYGGKNLNDIQQYSFSQKSIIHLIDKRQTNLDEINIIIKRIQPNSTEYTFSIKSTMRINQFIDKFLGGIYQKNPSQLFLVYVGKQLTLQKTFGQQFVANRSQVYCLHVTQDAKPIKPKKQKKSQNTLVIRKSIDQIPVKQVFSDEAEQQIQQNEPLKRNVIQSSQQSKIKPFKKKMTFTQEQILPSNDGLKKKRTFSQENILLSNDELKKKSQEFSLKQSNQANVSEVKNEIQKITNLENNDDYSDSPTNIINQYYNESSERLQEQIEINKYFQSNERNQNQQITIFQQQRQKLRNSARREIMPSAGYSNIFNNMIWQEGKQFIKNHQKIKDMTSKLSDQNDQTANKQLLGLMFTQEARDETTKQLQSFKNNTEKFNYSQEDEKKILNEFNSLFNNQQIVQDTATNEKDEYLKLHLQSKKWSPEQLKKILSKDYEKQVQKEQDALSHHSNKTDHTNVNSLSNLQIQSKYGFSDHTSIGKGSQSIRTVSNKSKYNSQQPDQIIEHPNEETINQQISEDLKDSFSILRAENKQITKIQQQQITTEQKNQCDLLNQQLLNSDIGVNQVKYETKEQNSCIDQMQSRFIKKADANILEIEEIQQKQIGQQLQNSDSLFKPIPIDHNRIEEMQFANFESGLIPLESKQIFSDSVIDQICASSTPTDYIMSQTLEVEKTLNVVYEENYSEQIESKENENILLNNLQQSIQLNRPSQEKEFKQNQQSQNTQQLKTQQNELNELEMPKYLIQQGIKEDQPKIEQNQQINVQIENNNNAEAFKQTNLLQQQSQQPNNQIQQQINKQSQNNQFSQKGGNQFFINNEQSRPQLAQDQNINNLKQQVNNDEQIQHQQNKKVQFVVQKSEKQQFQQGVNGIQQIQQQTAKQFIFQISNKALDHQNKQKNQFSQLTTTDFDEKQNLSNQQMTHQNDLHFEQDTDNLSALLQSAKNRFNTLNQQNSGGELFNFLKNNDNQIDTSKQQTLNGSKQMMEFTINIFSEKVIGDHKLTSEQQEQQVTKQIFLIPALNQIFNFSINQLIQKQQNLNEATQLKQQNETIKQLEEQHAQQTVIEQQQIHQIQKQQQQNEQQSAKQTSNQIITNKQQDIHDDDLLLSQSDNQIKQNRNSLKLSNSNYFVEESLECSGKFKNIEQNDHQFSHPNNIEQKQNINCSKQNQLTFSFKNSKAEFNGNDFICPIETENSTSYLDDIVKNYQDWKKSRAIKKQLQIKNRKMGLQQMDENVQLL